MWSFLQTSYGQNKALPLALKILSNSLGTEIKASHINISFFDEIQLDDVIAFDSEGDTLIYIQLLDADIGLFSFLNQKLAIDNLSLKGAKLNIRELSTSIYNFDHIIKHLESTSKTENSSDAKSWDISVDALSLEESQIDFSSMEAEISASIPSLKGDIKTLSTQESILHFNSLVAEGVQFSYIESDFSHLADPDKLITIPSLPLNLIIDVLKLSSTEISYDTNEPLAASSTFDPNHISLEDLQIESENFSWTDSIGMNLKKFRVATTDGFEITHLESEIRLSDQEASFYNTKIQSPNSDITFSGNATYSNFDTFVNDILKSNMTFDLDKSTLSKTDFTYFVDESSLPDINLELLDVLKFNGNLTLEKGKLDLKNFSIGSGSDMEINGSLGSKNISNISSALTFHISNFKSSQSFIQKLLPTIQIPSELNNLGSLKGNMRGVLSQNQVSFQGLNIKTGIGTAISGNGKIYALNDNNGPEFDFNFNDLSTNLNTTFTEKISIPKELKRLENVIYIGSIRGNMTNLAMMGNLGTSIGEVDLDAKVKFNDAYSDASYSGYIRTEDFDLGTMLGDTTFGIVNFDGNLKGSGLTIEKLETTVDGKIKSIYYDGNTYKDIVVDGKYGAKIFDGRIASNDKNLKFDINGRIDLSESKIVVNVTMDLNNFNLSELGLADSLMVLGGVFRGTVSGNSIDDILGEGSITNFSILTQKGSYAADSIITIKIDEINDLAKVYSLDGPFLEGEIKGKITPSTLVRFVKNYIKAYIPLEIGYDENIEDNLDKYFEENEDQNFVLSLETKDINPLLVPFLGSDVSVSSAKLGVNFSSQETRLDLKGEIDSLLYKGILFQHGTYFFDGRKSFINGNVNIEDISMDDEILVPITTINTVLNNKVADFNMIFANEDDVERLNLSGDLTRTDEYIITFKDSISLNGYNWKFSPYNQVIFGDYGLFLQDLKLSKESQAITIYTDENKNGEAIEVLFDNFMLSELTAIIDKENEYFEGQIDGSFLVNSLYSKPFLTADLGLSGITVDGTEAGNLSIVAAQDLASNSVNSDIRLSGPQNDATLKIDYGLEHQSLIGELDIGKLEMAIIDPYLTNIFINSEGSVNGKITINGNLDNIDLKGTLRTRDIKTTPVFTNSRYEILDTDISFSNREIDFGTVELMDKNKNSAFVTGKINHKNLRGSIVDLKVNTDQFEFLNTTEIENSLFYGNVNVKGNVSVYGPIDNIEIDGSVSAVNSSKLKVSPLSLEEDLITDNFIIYSGDPRQIPSDSLQLEAISPKIAIPFDVEIQVIVEEDSEFSMILDPITGDKITGNGTANLTLKLKKNGEMELYGTYIVSKGFYTFSYGLISKEFTIQPGSTVSFNGDPLKGNLNVDAIYVANTAVYDLIKLESTLDDAQKTEAQRKRNINVVLNLTKSIEKPEINLDITTDKDELSSSISDILISKLNQLREQPDELNNQVFGLLLFDNFILAKNAETDLAQTGTDLFIRSLSGLVGQQLNKLADGLIEGFEVNFDFNSYSSDFLSKGQEGVVTELGVGVKKSLFDDRLTLSVGTNINLESSANELGFGSIVGDFILGYKLNKDGSYRFTAYRKSSFDRLSAEGNSAKNGIGLFVRKEFGEIKKNKN